MLYQRVTDRFTLFEDSLELAFRDTVAVEDDTFGRTSIWRELLDVASIP